MSVLTFDVDLPPRECSPNSREDRRGTARIRAKYRDDVAWLAVAARQSMGVEPFALDPGRISLTFATKGARMVGCYSARDADNALAAFKAGLDGLVIGGIFRDDSAVHVTIGEIRIDPSDGPWVRVTVEAIP